MEYCPRGVLLLNENMPEWLFQREVVRYASEHGWLVHYTPPSLRRGMLRTQQGGDNGFPDLVLAREKVVLFIELKAQRGQQSPNQKNWATTLVSFHLWRPSDREEIERVLR